MTTVRIVLAVALAVTSACGAKAKPAAVAPNNEADRAAPGTPATEADDAEGAADAKGGSGPPATGADPCAGGE